MSYGRMRRLTGCGLLGVALLLVAAVYWPGLSGSWLFDDYPNIVDNHAVQPAHVDLASLTAAALSSPSSEFKRPLASLSFTANYLASGLHPFWWKFTNLIVHLLNGLLVFVLARALLRCSMSLTGAHDDESRLKRSRVGVTAALIASGWMLLPINLTGVLYVVQRMESMANLFVLTGLIGYVAGRRRMLSKVGTYDRTARRMSPSTRGFLLCLASITLATATGILAKETAVMLPFYALLIEWAMFGFRAPEAAYGRAGSATLEAGNTPSLAAPQSAAKHAKLDRRIMVMFLLVLLLPMLAGLVWLVPGILAPQTWAGRDFTLRTRLLSETRIVSGYIRWTLLPTPQALSFYHDDFPISNGLLKPWTTLASMTFLAALAWLMMWARKRRPLVALGIALFLGCQLLTATILPLELIYEHRNYFASFGMLLAIVPLLTARPGAHPSKGQSNIPESVVTETRGEALSAAAVSPQEREGNRYHRALFAPMTRYTLLAGLLLYWTALTATTAYAWGDPLRLAIELAARAPQSPRAQYELGRTYILYSHYDPASRFTKLAYPPLEAAAALPDASILSEQALIFMNARMHLPLKDAWWHSMITKLEARKPGIQDENSLAALTQCANEHSCDLPHNRMVEAFTAALSHPDPSARLLATYGDYAWNTLDNHVLGERMTEKAVKSSPREPAYRITLIRMLAAQGKQTDANAAMKQLEALNIGGRLDSSLAELRKLPALQ